MPKKRPKNTHICKRCKTRFRGRFCPYCGAEYGAHLHGGPHGGVALSLLKFILTLILLAAALVLAIAILDSTAYAHNPDNATAYAIIGSIRNAIPPDALTAYDAARENALRFLADLWTTITD